MPEEKNSYLDALPEGLEIIRHSVDPLTWAKLWNPIGTAEQHKHHAALLNGLLERGLVPKSDKD